jgi:small subunit ribosomal protein S2
MESQLRRELRKIKRNLNGIRNMEKLPGAMVIIDVRHETTALKEARKLGIPTVALIDTDGDPDLVDLPIPGNDDSMRSIDVVLRELCMAIAEGKQQRQSAASGEEAGEDAQGEEPRRRSRRAQFRAGEEGAGGEAPAEQAVATNAD